MIQGRKEKMIMMMTIIPIFFIPDQAILKKLSGIQNKFDLYLSVHFTVSIIFRRDHPHHPRHI